MEPHTILIRSALIALCLWSLLRGGAPEKAGAIIWLTGFIARAVLKIGGIPLDFHAPNAIYLVLSAVLFLFSLALALKANRLWPLVFSALLLMELSGHLSVLIIEQGRALAYWVTTQLPIIGQAIALTMGTWAHFMRQNAGIHSADWRSPLGEQQ